MVINNLGLLEYLNETTSQRLSRMNEIYNDSEDILDISIKNTSSNSTLNKIETFESLSTRKNEYMKMINDLESMLSGNKNVESDSSNDELDIYMREINRKSRMKMSDASK